MTASGLSQMDVMQLVAAYEASCRAVGDTLELNDSSAKINRLTKLQFAIEDQLAERPNGLQALELLFSSTSAWVRYSAAQSLLNVIPQQARAVIQAVVGFEGLSGRRPCRDDAHDVRRRFKSPAHPAATSRHLILLDA